VRVSNFGLMLVVVCAADHALIAQSEFGWMPPAEQLHARAICVEKALSLGLRTGHVTFRPATRDQPVPITLRQEQFATIGGHVNVIYFANMTAAELAEFTVGLRRNRGRFLTPLGALHIRRFSIREPGPDQTHEVYILAHIDRANPYSGANGLFKHILVDLFYGHFAQFVLQETLDSTCT
jgi:hypothetical protein